MSTTSAMAIVSATETLLQLGGVVALGKFDALHRGHRALAEQAAKMGTPVLLSFSGMDEVIGWEKRLPVVACCDRKRIMSLWAKKCGGYTPKEYSLEFTKVRSLSPQEFVKKLSKELSVQGVVAGANYRFGYKAAGDASDLVHYCNEYGLQSFIVDPVMDKFEEPAVLNGDLSSGKEKGQVSSTRVRKALASGDMARVRYLLGRNQRVIVMLQNHIKVGNTLCIPTSNALNQPPLDGVYGCTLVSTSLYDTAEDQQVLQNGVEGREIDFSWEGWVEIRAGEIKISWQDATFDVRSLSRRLLGLELLHKQ